MGLLGVFALSKFGNFMERLFEIFSDFDLISFCLGWLAAFIQYISTGGYMGISRNEH